VIPLAIVENKSRVGRNIGSGGCISTCEFNQIMELDHLEIRLEKFSYRDRPSRDSPREVGYGAQPREVSYGGPPFRDRLWEVRLWSSTIWRSDMKIAIWISSSGGRLWNLTSEGRLLSLTSRGRLWSLILGGRLYSSVSGGRLWSSTFSKSTLGSSAMEFDHLGYQVPFNRDRP